MRRALAFLIVLLIAGCFSRSDGGGEGPPGGRPPLVFPDLALDHDHKDPALHNASVGFDLVGFADAKVILGEELARFSDVQFVQEKAIVTLNGRAGSTGGGFVILDLSTLAAPTLVGRYRSGSEDNWYTKVSPDGKFVFLTANGNGSPTSTAGSVAGGGSPARGVHAVDITDPQQPTLAAFMAVPGRVVNLATWTDESKVTFLAASIVLDRTSTAAGPVDANDLNYVGIYTFEPPAGSTSPGKIEELARWQPRDAAGVANAFPHDLAVGVHPLNGKQLLFVAYWDAGGYILDVTQPDRPEVGSRIPAEGPTDHVHTFKPHRYLIGGRYYAVLAPETFGAEAAGEHRLFDITDARKPAFVKAWTPPPGDLVNPEPLLYSPHEFHLGNERLYASRFHGGVWVLGLPSMEPIATWQKSVGEPARTKDWAVDVSQVVWYNGNVFAVDMATGLLILAEEDQPFVDD
ncbi:MAG: hypothetical protein HYT80_04095 [Euryarchaeota archaeon]|nr:hypothetical protein [Euryarchaeota archaeon]